MIAHPASIFFRGKVALAFPYAEVFERNNNDVEEQWSAFHSLRRISPQFVTQTWQGGNYVARPGVVKILPYALKTGKLPNKHTVCGLCHDIAMANHVNSSEMHTI